MMINFVKQPNILGLAFLFTFVMAVYGGLLSLDGMKEWYPSLTKPFDIPIWLFGVVQLVYYCICITIIYRLYSRLEKSRIRSISISLFAFMMVFAESWNYFFLGQKSISLGFWLILVFYLIVLAVYFILRKVDRLSSLILAPYLIWLLVDIIWLFKLWQVN